MITIPNSESKQWKQDNSSDIFGNVFVSKNLDFDTQGYMSLSNSPRACISQTISSNFRRVMSIVPNSAYSLLAITNKTIYSVNGAPLSTVPGINADTGVPGGSFQSSGTWFNGVLVATQSTGVAYFTPATSDWTNTNIVLTSDSSVQHPVVNFLSLNRLAIANINTVGLYAAPLTASPTLVNTLTLPTGFYITSMVYFNQNLYIGTMNRFYGKAAVFVWNGSGTAYQSVFEVESFTIFDVCVFQDSIIAFIGNGSLMQFNGGGFSFLAAFPCFYKNQQLNDFSNVGNYNNILKATKNVIYIGFSNGENIEKTLTEQPSGIWCYDPKVGLYHRYAFSISNLIIKPISQQVNLINSQFLVSTPAVITGTEVYYKRNGGGITPLVEETKYFVIKIDATHVQLAKTKADALAGVYIPITSTGFFSEELIFFPNIDFGQIQNNQEADAIYPFTNQLNNPQYGTDVLWSGEMVQRNSQTPASFCGSTSTGLEARGYYVSPKIYSENVTDVFNLMTMKYKKLATELDKIIIKYRVIDDELNEIDLSNSKWQITWTSVNTFTTTDSNWTRANIGDEVSVLNGAAGGLLAHITNISFSAGTYTVTIDENFDNYLSGDLSTAIFRNWIKFKTITMNDSDGYFNNEIGVKGKFLQLKIEMRGVGISIENLSVDNTVFLPKKK